MLFNCKFTLLSNDTIKLSNTVIERNLLHITSSPQTAERINRDGCGAPVRATSLVLSRGRRGHRSTAAAVDVDAAITRQDTGCENTLLISHGIRYKQAGLRFK